MQEETEGKCEMQAIASLEAAKGAVALGGEGTSAGGSTQDAAAQAMRDAITSVRVALLHMPAAMKHAVASVEACLASISGDSGVLQLPYNSRFLTRHLLYARIHF
jgi:hypothetical protein